MESEPVQSTIGFAVDRSVVRLGDIEGVPIDRVPEHG
jgi:hypothetical protein